MGSKAENIGKGLLAPEGKKKGHVGVAFYRLKSDLRLSGFFTACCGGIDIVKLHFSVKCGSSNSKGFRRFGQVATVSVDRLLNRLGFKIVHLGNLTVL